MSWNASFRRKVIYVSMIVLLWAPLYWLGQPAGTSSQPGASGEAAPRAVGQDPGGRLAQLRAEHNLSQAQLGKIDPASESMKLATLGLSGVATTLLWNKAFEYKTNKQWHKLSATLNQIIKLQPNFVEVWEFQSHNLSYNVSVEFDDFRHRYMWVKKGIDFLIEGAQYNRDHPRLLWALGWTTGQKLGRSDEREQFRRMYRTDKDWHNALAAHIDLDEAVGPDNNPDSWLTSRLWFLKAEQAVETQNKSIGDMGPLVFYKDAPMSLMNYAGAIEEDGYLGERARYAWRRAGEEWRQYGEKPIRTSWGHDVHLGDIAAIDARIERVEEQLAQLAPGAGEALEAERREQLTEVEREALAAAPEERTDEQISLARQAGMKIAVPAEEIAAAAPSAVRDEARRLARELEWQRTLRRRTQSYRNTVNYDYWETRAAAEQTELATSARESLYQAEELAQRGLIEAWDEYEKAWELWGEYYDRFPSLMDDVESQDLVEAVERYNQRLRAFDRRLPADFPLNELLEMHNVEIPRAAASTSAEEDDAAEENAGDEEASGSEESKPTGDADDEQADSPQPSADQEGDEQTDAPSEDAPSESAEPEATGSDAASSDAEPENESPVDDESPDAETPQETPPESA